MTEPSRVAFRVPSGWHVDHHEWREVDPSSLAEGSPAWDYLQEDLAQLRNDERGLLVDIGWYPAGRREGRYAIVVLFENDWDRPVSRFMTTSLQEAISRLDAVLESPPAIPLQLLLESLVSTAPDVRARAATLLAKQVHVEALESLSAAYVMEKNPETFSAMQQSAVRSLTLEKKRRQAGL
jgi:hypothetical protein